MKKRLFLVALMVAIFACLFTLAVSAENKIIKLDTLPTLEQIHANPSAYVSTVDALETEDTYKATDPDSVVVLSDLASPPTYYVYPVYYFIKSTTYNIAGNISKFNNAISAADSTAFAGYTSAGGTWGNGECDYVIRIEMPKYLTSIQGQYKFEGSANVKEIYFPVYSVIDPDTNLEKTVPYCSSISGENLFGECPKLEVIHNMGYLPKGLVQGNNGGFYMCSSLREFIIPEGVTSIPKSFFAYCSSLTEIVLPNSVVSAGKMAFAFCTSLETIKFGANFTTFYSNNNDFEICLNSTAIKFVYLPDSDYHFKYDNGNETTRFYNTFNQGSNVTFFFTGSQENAQALKDRFIASTANDNFATAELVAYNPNVDYTTYAANQKKNIIVYNYSACEAFYDGEHVNAITYGFDGEDKYDSNFCMFDGCTRCVNKTTTSYGKLFTDKGYAKQNNGSLFTYGIVFNTSTISLYEEKMGATFDYGFVVANGELSANLVASDGTAVDGAIALDFSKAKDNFTVYNLKLTGIKDTQKDLAVYACAYIIDNGTVSYVGDGVSSSAKAITYNSIEAVIPETNIADEQ